MEIDLVGHDGSNASGEFCFTLTVTGIATGGRSTSRCATKPKGGCSKRWSMCVDGSRSPIVGIASDNGGEFINCHLLDWCTAQQITFTRSPASQQQ